MPSLSANLKLITGSREFAVLRDLCQHLNDIRIDSRIGFSVPSFVRQAILMRDEWLSEKTFVPT